MLSSGDAHRQEYLIGEAEDVIQYVAGVNDETAVGTGEGGENPVFSCNGFCVKTEEFVPPEPGVPTGEHDELLCAHDSLAAALADGSCGLDDSIMEQLCELSPVAFCE